MRGLSPRGRGKPRSLERLDSLRRSIPAWAGETYRQRQSSWRVGVYPRVGGGNCQERVTDWRGKGLSPRGRGKPAETPAQTAQPRSIPAWAGETAGVVNANPDVAVYPRVGGGNTSSPARSQSSAGLSPRGRGKQSEPPETGSPIGSIPAWAGETTTQADATESAAVYPRVGGGNVLDPPSADVSPGLSPRGRGKPPQNACVGILGGSIPAWAGETHCANSNRAYTPVYPRVGGGNAAKAGCSLIVAGLSPRGRGKHRSSVKPPSSRRSIPAWAGETDTRPVSWRANQVYPRVGGGNPTIFAAQANRIGLSPRGRGKLP